METSNILSSALIADRKRVVHHIIYTLVIFKYFNVHSTKHHLNAIFDDQLTSCVDAYVLCLSEGNFILHFSRNVLTVIELTMVR